MRRRLLGHRGANAIPQNDLVSEWKLEETSGTTFFDSKGTNHGTDANIPNLTVTGKVGKGFNWNSNFVASTVPYSSDFIFNDGVNNKPFSYAFWIYLTGASSTSRFINHTNVMLLAIVQNLIRLEYRDNNNVQYSANITDITKGTIPTNTWTHLSFTFQPIDATNNIVKIYKNGVEVHSANTPASIRNNITPDLKIGGNNFSGPMDEIKFYKRALTAAEILSIYNAEL